MAEFSFAFNDDGEDVEPTSPKVPIRKRREKRADLYEPTEGEQLYSPESHTAGMLLFRPDGSFAYVHCATAKFSEGVQGLWHARGEQQVKLEPNSFGYCYQDSVDANEILSVCPTIVLGRDVIGEHGRLVFFLPDELIGKFSWLDPTHQDLPETITDRTKPAIGALVEEQEEETEEPTSPKAPRKKRDHEKRAYVYQPKDEERLYCLRSHTTGMLLLRPDGSFAYVHDAKAKFSEGVQGEWREQGVNQVSLEPKSFGWCYEGSFDVHDVLGTCYTITLCEDKADESGRLFCDLPGELLATYSWLDPTRAMPHEEEWVEPTSPKIPSRKRRNNEKRARVYIPEEGELLFSPQSHPPGMLLLRPDNSFAYVHDSTARFSEGVQGRWKQQPENKVGLEPTSFGWCYEESFDPEEILGVCHMVTLCLEASDENGKFEFILSDECLAKLSWLDPTLPESLPMEVHG